MDRTDLAFTGIARQAALVASAEISSRELVEGYLERIERLDPQLRAFRVVFAERALLEAGQADARRGAGGERPLLGVPIAVKDDIDVGGERTAWGSSATGGPVGADSELVRRLREAGAVIIGKTAVPELTVWPFTETAAFGVTRNPWSLERTPGGSSGGSGAAVAAGLVGAALGSDGAGSIRIPSAWCGLFGLKPQRGRVPLAPRADAWHGLSVFGLLARDVADTALFLDVVSGATEGERHRAPVPSRPFADAVAEPPRALRIGVSRRLPPGALARVDERVLGAVESSAELLRSLGHTVEDHELDYGPAAFPATVARYLRGIHDDARGVAHPERLERRTRGVARMGGLVAPGLLRRALAAEPAIRARIGASFERYDAVITPATAVLAPRVGALEGRGALLTLGTAASWVPFHGIFNMTGQPAASVPAGFSADGLPLSIQLVGRTEDEHTVLGLAAQMQAARPWTDQRPAFAA